MSGGTQHPLRYHIYYWANQLDPQGVPQVQATTWDSVPKSVGLFKKFGGAGTKQNGENFQLCGISGVQCYNMSDALITNASEKTWVQSREHLLSVIHHKDAFTVDTLSFDGAPQETYHFPDTVIINAGLRLNKMLGHIPASLKLLLRRQLKHIQYDRTDYMNRTGNYDVIRAHKIYLENTFRMHGKYPWQPSTYEDVHQRAAAEEFTRRITQMDREFFRDLTIKNRWDYFDNSILPIEFI